MDIMSVAPCQAGVIDAPLGFHVPLSRLPPLFSLFSCTPSGELATETDLGLERSVGGSEMRARRGPSAAFCLFVRAVKNFLGEDHHLAT